MIYILLFLTLIFALPVNAAQWITYDTLDLPKYNRSTGQILSLEKLEKIKNTIKCPVDGGGKVYLDLPGVLERYEGNGFVLLKVDSNQTDINNYMNSLSKQSIAVSYKIRKDRNGKIISQKTMKRKTYNPDKDFNVQFLNTTEGEALKAELTKKLE
jgi:hypothetical protein